jgi:hypothetical protein
MDAITWALVGGVVVLTLWVGAIARLLDITRHRLDIASRRIDILAARIGILAGTDQDKEGGDDPDL